MLNSNGPARAPLASGSFGVRRSFAAFAVCLQVRRPKRSQRERERKSKRRSIAALQKSQNRNTSRTGDPVMIGVRLGCWIIEEEIGRGGMGAVYRARRAPGAPPGPDRAAVKVLAAELAV